MSTYNNDDPLIQLLDNSGFITEFNVLDNNKMQLEIYTDNIEQFPKIPLSLINEIQKYYNIISLSPQIIDIEGETFATLVLELEDIKNGA